MAGVEGTRSKKISRSFYEFIKTEGKHMECDDHYRYTITNEISPMQVQTVIS